MFFCEVSDVNPARRIVLTCYGLALALVLVWVPWRGGLEVRGGNRDTLGYCLVWSPPKPSPAFLEYESARDAYQRTTLSYSRADDLGFVPSPQLAIVAPLKDGLDWRDGIVQPPTPKPTPALQEPKKPEGYISSFVYASATVEYGRVSLEFGALTGLGIAGWAITGLFTRRQGCEAGKHLVRDVR